jgi:hypothetical protein
VLRALLHVRIPFCHSAAESVRPKGLGAQRAVALVVQNDDTDSVSAWRENPSELSFEAGEQLQHVLDGFQTL